MLRTQLFTLMSLSMLTSSFARSGVSGAIDSHSPVAPAAVSSRPPAEPPRIGASYEQLPLAFEPNLGQAASDAGFVAHGRGYALVLKPDGARLRLQPASPGKSPATVRMQLLGASRDAKGEALEILPGKANYFLGSDRRAWRQGIATFGRVRYRNVYPGVDVVYYGNQGRLEYDFVLGVGADPGRIQLEFSGTQALRVDGSGDLLLAAAGSELRLHRPLVYQAANGAKVPVNGRYRLLSSNRVAFEVPDYDRTAPLVIDPVLSYSALLGGSGWEMTDFHGKGLAVDGAGNVYITGSTWSTDLPTAGGPAQGALAGSPDVFVAKLSADGRTLLYSTYLGGTAWDQGTALAVDAAGAHIVIGGFTTSTNYPTLHAYQAANAGGDDAFVTALDGTGKLVFSTYLGGPAHDQVLAVATDSAGVAYVAGQTDSAAAFPGGAGFGTTATGNGDGFIAAFGPSGAIAYTGVLGGSGQDEARGIAVLGGAAYVTGETCQPAGVAADFPVTAGSYSTAGRNCDAFVTMITPGGTAGWSTFLGGTGSDEGWAIAVDASGVYVVGDTYSDFPVTSGAAAAQGGNADAFIAKLAPAGNTLIFARLFGGTDADFPFAVAVDPAGNPIVAGITSSQDFPVTADALQGTKLGSSNPVFATSNGGSSWTGVPITGLNAATLLRPAPATPGTVYASDGTYVYKSADGGATFPHNAPPAGRVGFPVSDLAVSPVSATTLYAATQGGGVRTSADGGVSWSPFGTGAPANVDVLAVSGDGATLYASSGTAVYRYAAGTWTAFPGVMPWAAIVNVTRLIVDPGNANTVYVGTEDGLYKSLNGGTSLSFLNTAPCVKMQVLTMDPVSTGTLYAVDAGMFCKSTNAGTTWTAIPVGINQRATALAVDSATPATIYAGFGTNGIYRTADSGVTWASATSGAPFRLDNVNALVANAGQVHAGVTTNPDIFVARLNATGQTISWATYLGGPGSVDMSGMAGDANSIWVLVPTSAAAFPVTPGAYTSSTAAANNPYIVKIATTGPCQTSLWPTGPLAADANGGAGILRVVSGSGCPWGAVSAPAWVHTGSWSGATSGLGLLEYSYDPNTSGSTRSGNISIGGQNFAITQAATGTCTITLSGPVTIPSAGGTATFTVTPAPASCSWTATSNDTTGWLTVSAGGTGTGSGTVTVNATANTAATSRSSSITVAPNGGTGATGSVTQTGAGACTASLLTTSANVAASGGLVTVQLISTPPGCAAWTVTGLPSWATLTSPAAGSGSGTASIQIAANTGAARTGTVAMGGQTFTINQAGPAASACSAVPIASLTPIDGALTTACASPRGAGLYGQQYSFSGTAGQQVAIELVSPDGSFRPFLTLTPPSGAAVTSNWYLDQPNSRIPDPGAFYPLPATGTYTIEVGNDVGSGVGNYTLQVIAACPVVASQLAVAQPAAGGAVTVPFTGSGCTWTATSFTPSWIQLTSAPSGSASGNLSFTVGANTAIGPRAGVIVLGGQQVFVSQAGASTSFSFSPPSASAGQGASNGAVTVTPSDAAAQWKAFSSEPWLAINYPAQPRQTGTASVSYSVAANAGPPRTAQIVAGGAAFTVTQAGTASPVTTPDFNGDGKPDILWRNTANGMDGVWFMDGLNLVSTALFQTMADQSWKIVGVGDFNQDGKPDILWRNTSNGVVSVWLMNGLTVLNTVVIQTIPDQNWQIVGVADFNGDGKSDILWRNTANGMNGVWFLDGTNVVTTALMQTISDQAWQIVGVGDFNGDGKPDLVWRNTLNGMIGVWLMDGINILNTAVIQTIPDQNWQIVGVADFNGDGKPDLLWRNNANGMNGVWFMDGLNVLNTALIQTISDLSWRIAGGGGVINLH